MVKSLPSRSISKVECHPSSSQSFHTPTGKLTLTMLGSVAAFEREIMLERQREGIARAKEAGKYKGRKQAAMAKADEVQQLQAEGG